MLQLIGVASFVIGVIDVQSRQSKIEKAMKNAETSLNAEGMYTTDEENDLIIKSLRGEISKAEFIKRAVELAKHER